MMQSTHDQAKQKTFGLTPRELQVVSAVVVHLALDGLASRESRVVVGALGCELVHSAVSVGVQLYWALHPKFPVPQIGSEVVFRHGREAC
jgi:hypothetical protein